LLRYLCRSPIKREGYSWTSGSFFRGYSVKWSTYSFFLSISYAKNNYFNCISVPRVYCRDSMKIRLHFMDELWINIEVTQGSLFFWGLYVNLQSFVLSLYFILTQTKAFQHLAYLHFNSAAYFYKSFVRGVKLIFTAGRISVTAAS